MKALRTATDAKALRVALKAAATGGRRPSLLVYLDKSHILGNKPHIIPMQVGKVDVRERNAICAINVDYGVVANL